MMEVAPDYLNEDFSKLVELLLEKHHVPGISIAVVDNGKIHAKVSAPLPMSRHDEGRYQLTRLTAHRGMDSLDSQLLRPRPIRYTSLAVRLKQW